MKTTPNIHCPYPINSYMQNRMAHNQLEEHGKYDEGGALLIGLIFILYTIITFGIGLGIGWWLS